MMMTRRKSGKQPRDIVLVEDYLCINYPDDNRIEFIDRKSFLSVKRIDTKDVWGEQGVGPRRLCHANQSIYVSFDATLFTRVNGRLFVVNAPKTIPETPVTFGYYDTDTQSSGTFDADGLENPSAMGFDEIDRRVYVACNGKDGNSGYVNIYSVEGKLVRRVETESHPIAFAVSYGSEEVE